MVKLSLVNSFSREKQTDWGFGIWMANKTSESVFFLGLEKGKESVTHVIFGCFWARERKREGGKGSIIKGAVMLGETNWFGLVWFGACLILTRQHIDNRWWRGEIGPGVMVKEYWRGFWIVYYYFLRLGMGNIQKFWNSKFWFCL